MAAADASIYAALQQRGWLEGDANWTVADLSSDALIVIVLKFLTQLQDASYHLPRAEAKAPFGVAARHRVGSQLAKILKELGYAGDCGYNHFLYPSENETRNILLWLVGKLPRSELAAATQVKLSQSDILQKEVLADIFTNWKQEKTLYLLPNLDVKGLRGFQKLCLKTSPLELPWKRHAKTTDRMFKDFPKDSIKSTSLLEALAIIKCDNIMFLRNDFEDVANKEMSDSFQLTDAAKNNEFGTPFPQPVAIQSLAGTSVAPEKSFIGGSKEEGPSFSFSHEMETKKEEQSLKHLQKQIDDTNERIAAMREVLDRKRNKLHKVEHNILEIQTTKQQLQTQLARQQQLLTLLPQASANIAKLEALCQSNVEKKMAITQQTAILRGPLLKEYAALQDQKASRKAQCRQYIHEIHAFRNEMLDMTETIHQKMETMQGLEKKQQLAERSKKKDVMTRTMYLSRIMEIIQQVYKQKHEISKILNDVKNLQRELKAVSEKLQRSKAVADETLYRAATKSKRSNNIKTEAYIDCYRKFAHVCELFEELVLVIGDAGKKENAARDLRAWISQLEARESSSQMPNLLADLQSVRLENDSCQIKLRRLSGKS
ncbi:hypothetical protein CCR75_005857 [Bremia lactucae]|uniref:Coiled-coil domain-containing protein 22 homolog n=1 Tax=Bremia lactucae TaxID=4779 RepID=A0A976FFY2_BRELC|nr:hypothetical protein CCR75_005857 [Bremia lactucae]